MSYIGKTGIVVTQDSIGATIQPYDADIPTVAASQAEMEAGTETTIRSMSPANVKQAIDQLSPAAVAGPAFRVYRTADQSVTSGVATKVQFNLEAFDTDNAFDSSTNYRFQPSVAGYYQLSANVRATATSMGADVVSIYVNGSLYAAGSHYDPNSAAVACGVSSAVVYLNGSTDYAEIYITVSGTTPLIAPSGDPAFCSFSGCLVRAA